MERGYEMTTNVLKKSEQLVYDEIYCKLPASVLIEFVNALAKELEVPEEKARLGLMELFDRLQEKRWYGDR
jgi:hypothetical protein